MPSDQVVENRVYSEGHSGADTAEIAAENEDDLSTDENQDGGNKQDDEKPFAQGDSKDSGYGDKRIVE